MYVCVYIDVLYIGAIFMFLVKVRIDLVSVMFEFHILDNERLNFYVLCQSKKLSLRSELGILIYVLFKEHGDEKNHGVVFAMNRSFLFDFDV